MCESTTYCCPIAALGASALVFDSGLSQLVPFHKLLSTAVIHAGRLRWTALPQKVPGRASTPESCSDVAYPMRSLDGRLPSRCLLYDAERRPR